MGPQVVLLQDFGRLGRAFSMESETRHPTCPVAVAAGIPGGMHAEFLLKQLPTREPLVHDQVGAGYDCNACLLIGVYRIRSGNLRFKTLKINALKLDLPALWK